MTEMTTEEEGWVKVLEELRSASGVDVSNQVLGAVESDLNTASAPLDPATVRCSPRFSEIGSQWETVEPYAFVSGEFYLTPVVQAVNGEAPDFSSSLHSDSDRALGTELRIIDEAPFTGSGSYTALRLQAGVANPEIWYADHRQGLWRMDLDYCEYLRVLTVTKGSFDWQHLFTDAPLNDSEFRRTVRRLTNMLDALPRVFPDHDYEPLRARLTERVGE
jgi:hypothetical protein